MDSHVTNTPGGLAPRLTERKQNFIALTARMCKFETGVNSSSNVSGSLGGSWPLPGQIDGPTAAGSHDQGYLKMARLQGAELINSQVQMMKMLEVPYS